MLPSNNKKMRKERLNKLKRKTVRHLNNQMMQPKLRRRAKTRRCGRKRRKHNTRPKMAPNNSYTAKNKRRTLNKMLRSMINLTSSLMMRRHMIKKMSKRILI